VLERFPEDKRRIELLDGQLVMAPAPTLRHQRVVQRVFLALDGYAKAHGGEAFGVAVDTYVSETNVVQPDAMYLSPDDVDPDEERVVRRATLVVEVSSPATRRHDLGRNLDLYAVLGVPECWFVDLEAERVEARLLEGGTYGEPVVVARGERLESSHLPGLALDVGDVLA
jgi:Uma2 family endonuclease